MRTAILVVLMLWVLPTAAAAKTVVDATEAEALYQAGDFKAARTAFMIKGDDITLDLNGHTVTYGTDVGVDYCIGVFLRPSGRQEAFVGVPPEGFGGGHRFTLKNGTVVQGQQPVAPEGAITYRGGRMVNEDLVRAEWEEQ